MSCVLPATNWPPNLLPAGPGEWKDSISKLMDELGIKPTGVRTHSCIHSHVLEMAVCELGFKYTSNTSRLFARGVQPARLAWGIWELPIYYMDNLDITMAAPWPELKHEPMQTGTLLQAIEHDGLYVFSFHPLHVCMNTPNLPYYLERSGQIKAGTSPFELRYEGRGIGTFFAELSELLAQNKQESVALEAALVMLT